MTDRQGDWLKDKTETVYRILAETYGQPNWRQHLPPVDELVNTYLSQSTSDTNRDRAFNALRERIPTWEGVMEASVEEIRDAIRPAGLANQKAPRIRQALRRIYQEQGRLSLDFLKEMPLEEARQWLVALDGVGPKTAAIVLLFAFNRPAFPVDTHVHRITKRLGLIGPKINAVKAHGILEDLAEPDTFYPFHLNLIGHGRQICLARKPKCELCPLNQQCDYYQDDQDQ